MPKRKSSPRAALVVQVPMKGELAERIDAAAARDGESRAEFIRKACRLRLALLETADLEQRYIEGYGRVPEDAAWADTSARALAGSIRKEKW